MRTLPTHTHTPVVSSCRRSGKREEISFVHLKKKKILGVNLLGFDFEMWEFRGRRCTSKWTPWMKKSQPFHFTQSRRRSQKSALKLSSVCSLYKAMDSLGGGNAGFSVCIPSCPLTSVLLPSLSCLLLSPHSLSRSVLKLLTLGGKLGETYLPCGVKMMYVRVEFKG